MSADQVEEKSRRRRRRRSAEDNDEAEEQETGLSEAKGRATPGRRNRGRKEEQKQGNFITRPLRGMFEYIDGVRDELRKVTWPTREELTRLTIIVSIATVVSSIVLGAIAFAFTELFILGFRNEIVFVIAGVVAVVLYFVVTRFYAGGRDSTPY